MEPTCLSTSGLIVTRSEQANHSNSPSFIFSSFHIQPTVTSTSKMGNLCCLSSKQHKKYTHKPTDLTPGANQTKNGRPPSKATSLNTKNRLKTSRLSEIDCYYDEYDELNSANSSRNGHGKKAKKSNKQNVIKKLFILTCLKE